MLLLNEIYIKEWEERDRLYFQFEGLCKIKTVSFITKGKQLFTSQKLLQLVKGLPPLFVYSNFDTTYLQIA